MLYKFIVIIIFCNSPQSFIVQTWNQNKKVNMLNLQEYKLFWKHSNTMSCIFLTGTIRQRTCHLEARR